VDSESAGSPRRRPTVAAITALIALGAAGLGLVFDVKPSLRPDPGTHFEADLSVFAVERGVVQADLLRRTLKADEYRRTVKQAKRDGYSLSNPGEVVYIEVTLQGFKSQATSLEWSIYDAKTESRMKSGDLDSQLGSSRTGKAPTDRTVQVLWLTPVFDSGHPYFVRAELYSSDRTLLAVADSKPFKGLRAP